MKHLQILGRDRGQTRPTASFNPRCPLAGIALCLGIAWFVPAEVTSGPAAVEPARMSPGEAANQQQTLLDLSKKETYVLLAVNADPEDVAITDVQVEELPTEHRLVPKSGIVRLGQPLDIQLQEPDNVRIRLAVVKRGKDLALRISPQVVLGKNNTIDLTQDRITRTGRNLQRRVKHLNSHLVGLASERKALSVWLITPGNKPLHSVKMVHMRMKLLDEQIRVGKQEVPLLQQQCAALARAAQFVRALHKNVVIRFRMKEGNTLHTLNNAEAQSAESRKDSIHKLKSSLKELRETLVWLHVLQQKPLLEPTERRDGLIQEHRELIAILVSSIATARRNLSEDDEQHKSYNTS